MVSSIFLILTIGPAGHVPGSFSSWVVSAAGLVWSSHVDISAAGKRKTYSINNLMQPPTSYILQAYV